MRLYYYRAPLGNFGDDLNVWLWPRLIPQAFVNQQGTIFIGIGTLLNHHVPPHLEKIVFGAGVGYGQLPKIDESWKFFFVRGPLTAQKLKLSSSLAITDPAILVKLVALPQENQYFQTSFFPHHESVRSINWKHHCYAAGINYIDPCGKVDNILQEIQRSHTVITEAMHGAIIADVLGIPWIPVNLHQQILSFKWQDWLSSLDMDYHPITLSQVLGCSKTVKLSSNGHLSINQLPDILDEIRRIGIPRLSPRSVLNSKLEQLQKILEVFKQGEGGSYLTHGTGLLREDEFP